MRKHRGLSNRVTFLFATLLWLASSTLLQATDLNQELPGKNPPKITVIIDDVGNNHLLGLRAAKLPPEVALSILPHTSFSHEIANFGHRRGMDILLHQPMESVSNISLLGPGPLLKNMGREQFNRVLDENLKVVPFVVGINNHMGSLLTTDQQKMNWLMEELKQRDLFFIDSRTSTQTIAENTALAWQVPTQRRKVFLDHLDEPEAIAEQFQRLLSIAQKNGHAIAIGHPRENTLKFLEAKLADRNSEQFTLVPVSELMNVQPRKTSTYVKCYEFDLQSYHYPQHKNSQSAGNPYQMTNCLIH